MNIHINVKNFGPIEKVEIDLRPLTVFVGVTPARPISPRLFTHYTNVLGGFHNFLGLTPLLIISILFAVQETLIHKINGRSYNKIC